MIHNMYDYHQVPPPKPTSKPVPQSNVAHSFENPAIFSHQQQQPAHQQQQYGSYQPPSSQPGSLGTPHGGYDNAQPQQQQYPGYAQGGYQQPPPPPPQPGYLPADPQQQQQHYVQQPPPVGQQPQYQNEQYQYQQQQHQQPPQQQQPQAPAQAHYRNPETIQYCAVTMPRGGASGSAFDFTDASVPRLMPADVEEDWAFRFPAADYVKPVSLRSVRPTVLVFPANNKISDTVGLPVGVTVSPFAETEIPVVDFTEIGNRVIRCRRCNGYINPFTTFTDKGTKWHCALCRQPNDTLREYGCSLDQNGMRADLMTRPELTHATVDFIATPEYMKTPPRRPIFLLMLDCSYAAVSSGLLSEICRGALKALEQMKDEEALRIGVVGYDTTVYFFNLRASLSAPRMVAAPDTVNDISNVNDAFKLDPVELPCPISDLVVPVRDSYRLIAELLGKLPAMFADTKEAGCAFGPALAASISMLENNGGKIVSSICSMPSHGQGALKQRFSPEKLSNQPKEYTMLAAANDWYKQRALACSSSAISVDVITGNAAENIDLATIAPLVRFTAGHIYSANALTMRGVANQVERILTRFTGWDTVMRVRTTPGLVIPNFYGHCYVREPELVTLPVGSEDSSFTVEFNVSPAFKGNFAYIQFGVMYTSRQRERRIRVHTLQVPVSTLYGEIMNSVNSIGMTCFLTKMCVDSAVNMPFPQAQQAINAKLAVSLKAVQTHLAKQGDRAGPEQLLLPEGMKFIPQILNGFFRSPAVGAATSRAILPDRRVASMAAVMATRPEAMLPGFLGWTFQVYHPQSAIEAQPMAVYSTQTSLTSRSVTVTILGEALVLWYGRKVNPAVLGEFGLGPVDATLPVEDAGEQHVTPEQAAQLRARTDALMGQLLGMAAPAFCIAVEPCPQGKGSFEPAMARALVEDQYQTLTSYKAYMADLAKRIST